MMTPTEMLFYYYCSILIEKWSNNTNTMILLLNDDSIIIEKEKPMTKERYSVLKLLVEKWYIIVSDYDDKTLKCQWQTIRLVM